MVEKIDSVQNALEYDHEKVLKFFEIIDKFYNEILVKKDMIKFLASYIQSKTLYFYSY